MRYCRTLVVIIVLISGIIWFCKYSSVSNETRPSNYTKDVEAENAGVDFKIKYYDSGKKKNSGPVRDGKPYGKWAGWNTEGIKEWEGMFKDGKRHGKLVFFDKNGKMEEWFLFDDGKLIESHPKSPRLSR